MNEFTVLVVDDDNDIRESIEIYLRNEQIKVISAKDGLEALEILQKEEIHLIIMDVMMPRMDGIRATFKIRENNNIPIIMLSAKTENTDKILGLNVGADDYISKPFDPMELVARVKSQLRRYMSLGNYSNEEKSNALIKTGNLVLNTETKKVNVDGKDINLTSTEYRIMELLMKNKGRVFSIEELYEKVWQEPFYKGENTVAVHIRRIREKIEINPKEPKYLKVVWGFGYKIE